MKKILYIASFLLITSTSCSDFLTQEPTEQRSIEQQFSNKENMEQAINGMYYGLEAVVSGKYFLYADLVGGNFTFTPDENDHVLEVPPALNLMKVYEFRDEEPDSEYDSFFENIYDIINQANLIIEHILVMDFISNEEKNQVKAECLAVRAFSHYLVSLLYSQQYGYTPDASHIGIVYNTRTQVPGVDYPKRGTMAETYELLKTDLDEALSLFTNKQALRYGPSYSYFNPTTTKALYAKIALQMNDWQKAYDYSGEIITTSGISLTETGNYVDEWKKPEEAVSEVILEFSAPRTSEGDVSSSVAHSFFSFDNTSNYNDIVASKDLINFFEENDIRKGLFFVEELPTSVFNIVTNQPYYFTWKFQDDPGTTYMRLSEMYLIRAEAAARLGNNLVNALADLNRIRVRASLQPLETTTNLLEEIFIERRRELAFEGNLFFDIVRYKKDVTRSLGCLSAVCNMNYPSSYFVLPIPEASIILNENMIQNEGY